MPEYTYLLETRLSAAQQNALTQVRDAAREAGMTSFLAGGAVRDLTTGSSVRDLDFAIQGNALALQEALEARGGTLWGQHQASRTLFFWFPGSVRVEVASTRSEIFPKPGQPVYTWNSIVDDLHRRDFTANAMALSLNEGSYGLLLDPLNGVADIEARQLRLVSNYGFLEDPARLVRAVRLRQRLGWTLEERTATRYENAKEADNFHAISSFHRGYELEEIAADEEALATLKALEAEGWMGKLFSAWTPATVDTAALEDLHRNRIQLLMQGIAPDLTAAHLEVLTARMNAKDREELKSLMVRPGLRAQWEGLEAAAKDFAKLLTSKEAATPFATWNLFHTHPAEPILWLAHTRKTPAVEAKFKNLFTVWPEAAKKVPIAMMLEMRITPELAVYSELLHELFLQQIDGKLETDEAMRAFLEAYSPPAPPPPVTLRRARSKKSEVKGKRKGATRDVEDEDEDEEDDDDEEQPTTRSDDDDDEEEEVESDGPAELSVGKKLNLDKVDLDAVFGRIHSDDDDEDLADEEILDDKELQDGKEDEEPIEPSISLVKTLPVEEALETKPSIAVKKAKEAGSPPIKPLLMQGKTGTTSPKGDAVDKQPEKHKQADKNPATPAKAVPAKQEIAQPAPEKTTPEKAIFSKAPVGSAKKAVAPQVKKNASQKEAVPAKTVKGAAPPAGKPQPTGSKKQPSTPAKTAAKPAKKTTAKAATPTKKR